MQLESCIFFELGRRFTSLNNDLAVSRPAMAPCDVTAWTAPAVATS